MLLKPRFESGVQPDDAKLQLALRELPAACTRSSSILAKENSKIMEFISLNKKILATLKKTRKCTSTLPNSKHPLQFESEVQNHAEQFIMLMERNEGIRAPRHNLLQPSVPGIGGNSGQREAQLLDQKFIYAL